MVSVSLTPPTTPTRSWDRTAWPLDSVRRWALRLALSLPLVLISIGADGNGFVSPELADLAERSAAVREGSGLNELSAAYPPIPTLLAAALPGGATTMAVVSALFGGTALQLVIARLVRRQVGPFVGAGLLLALVGPPTVWFQATQDPAPFMGLMLLVVSLDGFVRFVVRNDTAGGFAAGIALAGAFLCDPIALVYAIAIAISAPLLARRRGLGAREGATALVLLFPSLSMFLSWAFLEWRFTGRAFATVWQNTDVLRFGTTIAEATGAATAALVTAPLYAVTAAVVARRRRRAAATFAIPVLGLALASWLGLTFSPASAFVLLTVVALYSVPHFATRPERVVLGLAGLGQFVVATATVVDSERVRPFLDVIA